MNEMTEMTEMNEMTGVIKGGWEYVIAAYLASAVILLGYAGSVVWRYRRERSRRDAPR